MLALIGIYVAISCLKKYLGGQYWRFHLRRLFSANVYSILLSLYDMNYGRCLIRGSFMGNGMPVASSEVGHGVMVSFLLSLQKAFADRSYYRDRMLNELSFKEY